MVAQILSLTLLITSALASPLQSRHNTLYPTSVASSPTTTPYVWNAGAVTDFQIHNSCNATQKAYLQSGLQEALILTRQAGDHILRWGNQSEIYQKYFGKAPTGEPLGWFTKFTDGDKSDILFRCDNIDGNCELEGWAGHWRGENATSETVICDLSYELRRPLKGMCMFGYDVANGATNFYWASDLFHRLLHIPRVGEGIVQHYGDADEYSKVLALAKSDPALAVRNSDSLQYFALEVYAHDIAVPGVGCPGTYISAAPGTTSAVSASATSSVSSDAAASTTSSASSTVAETTSSGVTGACTPHGDHWHCPPGVPEPTSSP